MLLLVLALVLAVLTAPYLHEGSHWFIGWLGKTNPYVEFEYWIIPISVHHREIETMDAEFIRISGLAPLLWIPVAFFATVHCLIEPSPGSVYAAVATIFTIIMSTESDECAFRDPERFRENALNGELSRKPLFWPKRS